ncbi:hypothetical protein BKA62DRAFT_696953 [Auriculariales sp. MPI-PUGE-AT-0066]|nr:hypothetical protein BKA62DRAFT_696953 [Auriculariales sp. MPI-PUGE-AT-0066]
MFSSSASGCPLVLRIRLFGLRLAQRLSYRPTYLDSLNPQALPPLPHLHSRVLPQLADIFVKLNQQLHIMPEPALANKYDTSFGIPSHCSFIGEETVNKSLCELEDGAYNLLALTWSVSTMSETVWLCKVAKPKRSLTSHMLYHRRKIDALDKADWAFQKVATIPLAAVGIAVASPLIIEHHLAGGALYLSGIIDEDGHHTLILLIPHKFQWDDYGYTKMLGVPVSHLPTAATMDSLSSTTATVASRTHGLMSSRSSTMKSRMSSLSASSTLETTSGLRVLTSVPSFSSRPKWRTKSAIMQCSLAASRSTSWVGVQSLSAHGNDYGCLGRLHTLQVAVWWSWRRSPLPASGFPCSSVSLAVPNELK